MPFTLVGFPLQSIFSFLTHDQLASAVRVSLSYGKAAIVIDSSTIVGNTTETPAFASITVSTNWHQGVLIFRNSTSSLTEPKTS